MMKLAENLARLRRECRYTQAEVAEHLGVTKASVSKWETGQTMPDVALLPLLASYYGVTLDELMGYDPMLTPQQIRAVYEGFSVRFAGEGMAALWPEIRVQVRRYYSCWPFLFQMAVLLLNHTTPADIPADQPVLRQEILAYITDLCRRVEAMSPDPNLRENARGIRLAVDLQTGQYEEIIEELSDLMLPEHMGGMEDLLIMAHMCRGELDEADRECQITLYRTLLMMVQTQMRRIALKAGDAKIVDMNIRRTEALIDAYDLIHLHPNTAAAFYITAAQSRFAVQADGMGEEEAAQIRHYLDQYHKAVIQLFRDDLQIHGDAFFPEITGWFRSNDLGASAPRSREDVLRSALEAFELPVLQRLDPVEMKQRREKLQKECEVYVRIQ